MHHSESSPDFGPSASIEMLRVRSAMLSEIRRFFQERGYWEVDTPVLSVDTTVDAHLDPFSLSIGGKEFFLQTSPEFAMKRLLAAGAGSIFQISRVFRDGEFGSIHNPEFTMIEWYRVHRDYHFLMDEVNELLERMIGSPTAERMTYQQAFIRWAEMDPHTELESRLRKKAAELGMAVEGVNRDGLLNFLLAALVEPNLGVDRPLFLFDYPAAQGALARIDPGPPAVAERFELYIKGVELCNGYQELLDPAELLGRSRKQNEIRRSLGKRELPVDSRLQTAMEHGLPSCAGVALGFDRLLMLAADANNIRDVVAFFWNRA